MKRSPLVIAFIFLITLLSTYGCKDKKTTAPCEGHLVKLNVENKLDNTIFVTVKETNDTASIQKDYIFPFSLAGNQSYTLSINGSEYHKETVMKLTCNDTLAIVTP